MFKTANSLFDNLFINKSTNFKILSMKNPIRILGLIIVLLTFILSDNLLYSQKISKSSKDRPEVQTSNLEDVTNMYYLAENDEISSLWTKLCVERKQELERMFSTSIANYDRQIFDFLIDYLPESLIEQKLINAKHNRLKRWSDLSDDLKEFEISVQQIMSKYSSEFVEFEKNRNRIDEPNEETFKNIKESKEYSYDAIKSNQIDHEIREFAISKGLEGDILKSNAYRKFQIACRISSFSKGNNINYSRFLPNNED